MLNLPRRQQIRRSNRYNSLGLRDLPFAPEPVLNPNSRDPRVNGTIYATSPVGDTVERFERLLIRPDDFQNRVKLAFLWSKGDVQQGHGMGKTALLRYFQRRINKDWGATEFSGQFSAVVVYASFPQQVDRRYMEQLAWAALVDICRNGVLDVARAALRRDALSDQQVEAVVTADEDYGNLLNDAILEANQISPSSINGTIEKQLIDEGVGRAPARALVSGDFEEFVRDLRRDKNLEPYYIPRDTKGLDYSRSLFFNDVVNYLRVAGFAGGYLFIDDIENLVDQMPRRHRIAFAKEFGLCTVRPGYANTTYNFFSCVLTTHQSSSIPLAQAWSDAGLAAMARLDPAAPTSVELPLPTKEQAREIVVAHLDHFRINRDERGQIKPFTEKGLVALVGSSQHPRELLSNAARVLQNAAASGVVSINDEMVKRTMENTAAMPVAGFSEDLDEVL